MSDEIEQLVSLQGRYTALNGECARFVDAITALRDGHNGAVLEFESDLLSIAHSAAVQMHKHIVELKTKLTRYEQQD